MNRKLQHTVQALTASVAVFGLLLLAGGPPPAELPAPTVLMATADAGEAALAPALAMPYFSFAKGGLRHVTGS